MHIYDFKSQIANHKEYAERKLVLTSKPTIENIELMSICNLECVMCIDQPYRKTNILSLSDMEHIIKDNKGLLEGEYVWLHHYGEPLLHPELTDIVSLIAHSGIHPRLSTNATLLTPSISSELIKSGLKEIVFSFDAMPGNDYEKIRSGANYAQTLDNILNFLKLKDDMGTNYPQTQVQAIDFSKDEQAINEFIEFWRRTSINWINIKQLSTRANNIRDNELRQEILKNKPYFNGPCYWLWSSLIILSDGDIVPCCTDVKGELRLGNVFKDSLSDIWNSEFVRNIREEHKNGKHDISRICSTCPEKRGYNYSFEDKLRIELTSKIDQTEIKINSHRLIRNV